MGEHCLWEEYKDSWLLPAKEARRPSISRHDIYNKTSIIRIFRLCKLASRLPSATNICIQIFDYLDS